MGTQPAKKQYSKSSNHWFTVKLDESILDLVLVNIFNIAVDDGIESIL